MSHRFSDWSLSGYCVGLQVEYFCEHVLGVFQTKFGVAGRLTKCTGRNSGFLDDSSNWIEDDDPGRLKVLTRAAILEAWLAANPRVPLVGNLRVWWDEAQEDALKKAPDDRGIPGIFWCGFFFLI